VRQVANVLLGTRRADAREGLFVGGAENVQNLVKLVDVVATLEEGAPTEKLGENAANRPNVNYRESAFIQREGIVTNETY
jgi:hypothetical protein